MNVEVIKIFTPAPMVSFTDSRKINSYLVRAKLYPLEGYVVGSCRCSKKREVYVNISRMDTFTTNVAAETYKMNHVPPLDLT